MIRQIILWSIAAIITVLVGYYQRITGPTYPVSGSATIAGKSIHCRFDRSHDITGNAVVTIRTGDPAIEGHLEWKRYKTNDGWTDVEMKYANDTLRAELPVQPPAGKLMYRIRLAAPGATVFLPTADPIVIRFKGMVPTTVLIFHIIVIFGAMLLSTRTGLEYFNPRPKIRILAYWTIGFLAVGGAILGPLVQYNAFGVFWSGWPYGTDLTDNKTAIALIGWIVVALIFPRLQKPKIWALGAAILVMFMYLIPHSLLGSELDYSKINYPDHMKDTILVR